MLCGEGETVVVLASERAFDLTQVLGARRASDNNTFVQSREVQVWGNTPREIQGPLCCGSGK